MRFDCFLSILVVLLLTGCRSEPVTWRVPLHDVILLNDTLDWATLVPDSLWVDGEEGLWLQVNGKERLVDSDVLVPALDTAWVADFEVPFIGGPIPLPAGTSLWTQEEEINLNIPDAALRRLRLGSGKLLLSVESTVQGPLELRYILSGATFPQTSNGGSSTIVLDIAPEGTSVVELDLAGVVFDLSDGAGGFGGLLTAWEILVPATVEESVPVFGDDALSLNVAFQDVEVAQVEGQFGSRSIELNTIMELEGGDVLQALDVDWTLLGVGLEITNTTGLDLELTLDALNRTDSTEMGPVEEPLIDPVLGMPLLLTRANVLEVGSMADWQIAPTAVSLFLGAEGSTLADWLGSIPDVLTVTGAVELNPLGDVSGGYDRVDLGRLPTLEYTVMAPLQVGYSRAEWRDTLLPEIPEGVAFSGEVEFEVESSLPVGTTISLRLVDVPPFMLTPGIWPDADWYILPDLVVPPGSGDPAFPVRDTLGVALDGRHADALKQGARVVAEVVMETPEAGAQFSVEQSVVIRGHLDGDLILSVE